MIVVAVIFIENEHGEYLFLNRTREPFGYALPGGINDKETLKQTIEREILEETNIRIDPSNINSVNYVLTQGGKYIMHVYRTKIFNVNNIILNDEHDNYVWRRLDKLKHLKLAENTDLLIDTLKIYSV